MSALSRDTLLDHVRAQLFAPSTENRRYVGAELEMIPVHAATGERALAKSVLPILRGVARREVWIEKPADPDPPSFTTSRGESISFEPGGQVEISGPPLRSASALIEMMRETASRIQDELAGDGIELRAVGIEPRLPVAGIPPQLTRPRYRRMAHYFDSLGESGVTMMRQTASLQINVERGADPLARWKLLNALAPYLVAIFANSPRYEGMPTGHKSTRAHIWRTLDPRRSGIPWGESAADAYLDFALDAPVLLGPDDYPAFGEWLGSGGPTIEDWTTHLSTLFPEIRPRDYFEIRSIDSLPPSLLPAPVVFVCGIVYDDQASRRASRLLGDPDAALLERAGRLGVADRKIGSVACELAAIAMDGAGQLGERFVNAGDLAEADRFFSAYTRRGLCPADDIALHEVPG